MAIRKRERKGHKPLVGIVGMGYVGLPLAGAFWRGGARILGFDINEAMVKKLNQGKSPIKGVKVEIPPRALPKKCTITIGVVTNPPALPAHTKAIGRVIQFGPSGTQFSKKVSIEIPYTQQDLDNAGVSDPAHLEVFSFDECTFS